MANNNLNKQGRDKIGDMSNELVTNAYLDQTLEQALDQAFGKFAEEIGSTLQALIVQIDDRFNRIENRLDDHDKKFERVLSQLDHAIGRFDKYDQEQAFANRQINRLEERTSRLAKHTSYKFKGL